MSNYYSVLWVDKNASKDDIKKAYRKNAMKYHPDKNKWDKSAEAKFKEINEAYWVLWDDKKRKQYDTFWSAWWSNPFWWWNPFGWWAQYSQAGFWWFEDIFSQFWWSRSSRWSSVNFEDLFWWMWWSTSSQYRGTPKEPVSLDFEKTYEVPVFDMILWCSIEVRGVYWNTAKLKIPAWTKPGTKFRVKDFWKSEWSKKWNLLVKVEAKMPKNISDIDKKMIETIRDNVGY